MPTYDIPLRVVGETGEAREDIKRLRRQLELAFAAGTGPGTTLTRVLTAIRSAMQRTIPPARQLRGALEGAFLPARLRQVVRDWQELAIWIRQAAEAAQRYRAAQVQGTGSRGYERDRQAIQGLTIEMRQLEGRFEAVRDAGANAFLPVRIHARTATRAIQDFRDAMERIRRADAIRRISDQFQVLRVDAKEAARSIDRAMGIVESSAERAATGLLILPASLRKAVAASKAQEAAFERLRVDAARYRDVLRSIRAIESGAAGFGRGVVGRENVAAITAGIQRQADAIKERAVAAIQAAAASRTLTAAQREELQQAARLFKVNLSLANATDRHSSRLAVQAARLIAAARAMREYRRTGNLLLLTLRQIRDLRAPGGGAGGAGGLFGPAAAGAGGFSNALRGLTRRIVPFLTLWYSLRSVVFLVSRAFRLAARAVRLLGREIQLGARYGTQLYLSVRNLNIAVPQLIALRQVFEGIGLEADRANNAIQEMIEQAGRALTGTPRTRRTAGFLFQQLGIDEDSLRELRNRPRELFDAVIQGLTNLQSITERYQVAAQLLGEEFIDLVGSLDEFAAAQQRAAQHLKNYGTLTEAQLLANRRLTESLARLRSTWNQIRAAVAAALEPTITAAIEKFYELTGGLENASRQAFAVIDTTLRLAGVLGLLAAPLVAAAAGAAQLAAIFLILHSSGSAEERFRDLRDTLEAIATGFNLYYGAAITAAQGLDDLTKRQVTARAAVDDQNTLIQEQVGLLRELGTAIAQNTAARGFRATLVGPLEAAVIQQRELLSGLSSVARARLQALRLGSEEIARVRQQYEEQKRLTELQQREGDPRFSESAERAEEFRAQLLRLIAELPKLGDEAASLQEILNGLFGQGRLRDQALEVEAAIRRATDSVAGYVAQARAFAADRTFENSIDFLPEHLQDEQKAIREVTAAYQLQLETLADRRTEIEAQIAAFQRQGRIESDAYRTLQTRLAAVVAESAGLTVNLEEVRGIIEGAPPTTEWLVDAFNRLVAITQASDDFATALREVRLQAVFDTEDALERLFGSVKTTKDLQTGYRNLVAELEKVLERTVRLASLDGIITDDDRLKIDAATTALINMRNAAAEVDLQTERLGRGAGLFADVWKAAAVSAGRALAEFFLSSEDRALKFRDLVLRVIDDIATAWIQAQINQYFAARASSAAAAASGGVGAASGSAGAPSGGSSGSASFNFFFDARGGDEASISRVVDQKAPGLVELALESWSQRATQPGPIHTTIRVAAASTEF